MTMSQHTGWVGVVLALIFSWCDINKYIYDDSSFTVCQLQMINKLAKRKCLNFTVFFSLEIYFQW